MEGLEQAMASVTAELGALEAAREDAIRESRKVIRLTKNVIHSVHIDAYDGDLMGSLQEAVDIMLGHCDDPRVLDCGPVTDALSEFAEAVIFVAAVRGDAIPGPGTMGIDAGAWVLGLADSIGELRRMLLKHLNDRDIGSARAVFDVMERFYDQLALMDVPDAIVPLRRKQDIARGIMDRTRSDLTTAVIMSRD